MKIIKATFLDTYAFTLVEYAISSGVYDDEDRKHNRTQIKEALAAYDRALALVEDLVENKKDEMREWTAANHVTGDRSVITLYENIQSHRREAAQHLKDENFGESVVR
jgi:hypothetical protein